jgi:hypothetical protein
VNDLIGMCSLMALGLEPGVTSRVSLWLERVKLRVMWTPEIDSLAAFQDHSSAPNHGDPVR